MTSDPYRSLSYEASALPMSLNPTSPHPLPALKKPPARGGFWIHPNSRRSAVYHLESAGKPSDRWYRRHYALLIPSIMMLVAERANRLIAIGARGAGVALIVWGIFQFRRNILAISFTSLVSAGLSSYTLFAVVHGVPGDTTVSACVLLNILLD